MHSAILTSAALVIAALVVATIRLRRNLQKSSSCLPPGPPPLQLIGNAHQIDPAHPWVTFADWRGVYGDIVYTRVLGRDIIVINTEKKAEDLLDKRSRNYSDRMNMSKILETYGHAFDTALLNHDSVWRGHRRVLQQSLRPEAVASYHPIQLRCTSRLLDGLVDAPGLWWKHLQVWVRSSNTQSFDAIGTDSCV
ncbi:cytochrome P450 [Coniophora puteana RWD-64-598 SS2]|uniref:Cytochrome P450 n=1 Tax=Coniophora puteana (strain RWD-64-598) TaxID=741705 RepID=A0A5M3N0M4_CONPW|nr:cytochrome P450 [Coniophora puteana RWD-64-598 SS2]EIW84441.1 cytochrome P450 [Coniophora puteana RWD-64-598 SS2]